jgi:cytochrome c oxidase assembly protein subunit 15
VWRVRRDEGAAAPVHPRMLVIAVRAVAAFGAYVIVAGTFATAAGPHAGGAGTGDYVERLHAFGSSTMRTLIHLHGHSATALGLAVVGLWILARARRADGELRRALTLAAALMALQAAGRAARAR